MPIYKCVLPGSVADSAKTGAAMATSATLMATATLPYFKISFLLCYSAITGYNLILCVNTGLEFVSHMKEVLSFAMTYFLLMLTMYSLPKSMGVNQTFFNFWTPIFLIQSYSL